MKVRFVVTDVPGGIPAFVARKGDLTIIVCDRVAFPAMSVEEQLRYVGEIFDGFDGGPKGGTRMRLVA